MTQTTFTKILNKVIKMKSPEELEKRKHSYRNSEFASTLKNLTKNVVKI